MARGGVKGSLMTGVADVNGALYWFDDEHGLYESLL